MKYIAVRVMGENYCNYKNGLNVLKLDTLEKINVCKKTVPKVKKGKIGVARVRRAH